jgi:hypothetical protein
MAVPSPRPVPDKPRAQHFHRGAAAGSSAPGTPQEVGLGGLSYSPPL